MDSRFEASLAWVRAQHGRMRGLVTAWAEINSGTQNLEGLRRMAEAVTAEFSSLGGDLREIELRPHEVIGADGAVTQLPLGKAIAIRKRPGAARQVFLGIHMDTVYGAEHPFRHVEQVVAGTLRGPGVADAKGGLAVMLVALEALERSELAGRIGWEVLINPDEEIGSPGSAPLLAECAARNHLGLVYEPALADGTLVGARKGSGNFSAIARGKSAHAGRDFHLGRNAVLAAARLAVGASSLGTGLPGVTVNVGRIDGGGPTNVVPDLAICRLNVRVESRQQQVQMEEGLRRLAAEIDRSDGVSIELHGGFLSPPKPMDDRTVKLYEMVAECGEAIGLPPMKWQSSGGASDANKLAAAGLPVIDTLGVRGGNLHSPEEYMLLDSLTERAALSALLLLRLAAGEIQLL